MNEINRTWNVCFCCALAVFIFCVFPFLKKEEKYFRDFWHSRKEFFYGCYTDWAIQIRNYHDRKTTFDMLLNKTQFPSNITI